MVLRVDVPAGDADVAADLLWQSGATAVSEEPAGDGAVTLTADLAACPDVVAGRGWGWAVLDDDGAWADGWRPFARAVRAGPFLVRPPWVEAPAVEGTSAPAVELVLDGARAFGTGSHPSTILALDLLAGVARPGASVLDAGCGSGALAVGAALLGAVALAVDLDPAAVEATDANAAANGVADRVSARRNDVAAVTGRFDVVAANLGSPLVIDLAPLLGALVADGGALILSGLLEARVEAVVAAYPDLRWDDRRSLDGWAALLLVDAPAA